MKDLMTEKDDQVSRDERSWYLTYSRFPRIRGRGEVTNDTTQHGELCDGALQTRKDSWYGAGRRGSSPRRPPGYLRLKKELSVCHTCLKKEGPAQAHRAGRDSRGSRNTWETQVCMGVESRAPVGQSWEEPRAQGGASGPKDGVRHRNLGITFKRAIKLFQPRT